MKKLIRSEIVILLLSLVRTGFGEGGTRVRAPIKRSYQLPHVAFINNPQGLQYYAAAPTGSLYTIPTVLIPSQLGLSATPIASVVLPPSSDPKPSQEFQETSTPHYETQKPVKISPQLYKQKHRSHSILQTSKRPLSYVNAVYGHPVRMKPLSSVPLHKQKISSVSIQPSVDLSGQFSSQEAASNMHSSTVGPPVASTYGPPKTVDFQFKTRLSGVSSHPVYHKLKGPSQRHTFYPTKKLRVYSHVHKDHIHNHYLPSAHALPIHKPKYAAPAYLPPAPSTPPTFAQEHTPAYIYQTGTHIRFPDDSKPDQIPVNDQQELHKPNYSPGDVTQAIIKHPGVINNFDANIPLHVPSKKPYQFEVNEILKNSELHFVEESPTKNTETASGQTGGLVQYQEVPYQNVVMFSPHQQLYSPVATSGALDVYNLPGINAYQSNHIVPEQDLGTSETVRVPVAVIRGAHNIASQGMFGFTVKRQDEPTNPEEGTKKGFTPSKRTSDWIPMSGSGMPLAASDDPPERHSDPAQETYPGELFAAKKETKTARPQVGDIISGKIPEKFSPKSDIISGKINYLRSSSSEREKRKGSVIDVYPSASSEVLGTGDTSDLVVSSVPEGILPQKQNPEGKPGEFAAVNLADMRSKDSSFCVQKRVQQTQDKPSPAGASVDIKDCSSNQRLQDGTRRGGTRFLSL